MRLAHITAILGLMVLSACAGLPAGDPAAAERWIRSSHGTPAG